jgi:hypothetical protein
MLDSYLRKVNPYSKAYKQMHETMEEQELRLLENGTPGKMVIFDGENLKTAIPWYISLSFSMVNQVGDLILSTHH